MISLSIWGAVTATIGTILGIIGITFKIKEFNKNKPNLICKSEFKYISINLDVRIIISSAGRTPVELNKIKIYVLPKKFWMRLLKSYYYRLGKGVIELDTPKRKIYEQEKIDLKFDIPRGLEYSDIYRVYIIDGVHKEWAVDWPRASVVKKKTQKIMLDEFEIKNIRETVILTSYQLGQRFYLNVKYDVIKGKYISGRWFFKKKELLETIEKIRLEQEKKFIDGEIDQIDI